MRVLRCKLLEDRVHVFARLAPVRPKVHSRGDRTASKRAMPTHRRVELLLRLDGLERHAVERLIVIAMRCLDTT